MPLIVLAACTKLAAEKAQSLGRSCVVRWLVQIDVTKKGCGNILNLWHSTHGSAGIFVLFFPSATLGWMD
jgi:hypothetical protein